MKKLLTLIVIAGMASSCGNMNNQQMADNMSNGSSAKNEARMQQFYDQILNAHNYAMADSFCTADVINHNPGMGHTGKGLEDVRNEFKDFFTMYPDLHVTTKNIISRGDTIFAYITMQGTNTGSVPNMPATNKSFNIDGVDIVKVKDGKAMERWGYFEDMKMMKQLGMMPEPGKMGEQRMEEEKMGKMEDGKMKKTDKKKK